MSDALRLHFNERPDCLTKIDQEMPFDQNLWQYPDRVPLQNKLADKHGVAPGQILATNGGDEAIMILMRILNEGVPMILPLPAFSQYTWGIESWNLSPTILQPSDNLDIDLVATRQAVEQYPVCEKNITSPAAVVILTSPNNPTGQQLGNDYLAELIQLAEQRNVWVFLDEAYIEFSQSGSDSANWLRKFDNLIVLKTLSKAFGLAGIRLGYILGNADVIAEFTVRCAPFNLPTPTLSIAEQTLKPEIQDDVANYCQQIQANRNSLFNWLSERDIPVINGEANFLMMPLGELRAKMVSRFLERKGILVRQFSGDLSHCVRITIPFHMDSLMACLEQLFSPDLVCLDMDGVLIDTSDSYDTTIKATIEKMAGKQVDFDQIQSKRNSGGYNNDWVLTHDLLADLGVERTLDEVTEVFQGLYLGEDNNGYVSNEKPLVQKSLVERIVGSKAPGFGIVTGRPLPEAKAGQAMIGLSSLGVISMDCAEPKPAPDGIQRFQDEFGKNSWMCGDNPDDIQAAYASGSVAIGIRADDQEALYEAGADIVLASINELEQWL